MDLGDNSAFSPLSGLQMSRLWLLSIHTLIFIPDAPDQLFLSGLFARVFERDPSLSPILVMGSGYSPGTILIGHPNQNPELTRTSRFRRKFLI